MCAGLESLLLQGSQTGPGLPDTGSRGTYGTWGTRDTRNIFGEGNRLPARGRIEPFTQLLPRNTVGGGKSNSRWRIRNFRTLLIFRAGLMNFGTGGNGINITRHHLDFFCFFPKFLLLQIPHRNQPPESLLHDHRKMAAFKFFHFPPAAPVTLIGMRGNQPAGHRLRDLSLV